MNEIDALTLKLLTSKKRYNTYLATANPDKSAEIQEYYSKIRRNKSRMKEMIGKYLDNPETETNNEIDDMFENCFKTLLKHFEMQDYEDKCAKHGYDATDSSEEDEQMFAEADADACDADACDADACDADACEETAEKKKEKEKKNSTSNTSFWGNNIHKRSSTLDKFIVKK
jgi:hypothetical protein